MASWIEAAGAFPNGPEEALAPECLFDRSCYEPATVAPPNKGIDALDEFIGKDYVSTHVCDLQVPLVVGLAYHTEPSILPNKL
jgi:hypothetical protein